MAQVRVRRGLYETPRKARDRTATALTDELLTTGGFLLVRGRPGSGATSFLRTCATAAREHVVEVFDCSADFYERDLALSLIDRLRALHPRVDPVLADVGIVPTDVGQALVAAAEGYSWWPEAPYAAKLMVVVDDLQWCDPESAQVLRFVIPRLMRRNVVFVMTLRLGTFSAIGEYLQDLALNDPVGRLVKLEPLDAPSIQMVVRDELGISVGPLAAAQLAAASGGEFGTLGAILDTVTAAERAELVHTRSIPLRVTRQVAQPALQTLRRSPPPERVVTEICAIAKRPLTDRQLLEIAQQLNVAVDIDRATATGLVLEDQQSTHIALRQPLLAELITEECPTEHRREIHQAIADHVGGSRAAWHRLAAAEEVTAELVTNALSAALELEVIEGFSAAAEMLDMVAERVRDTKFASRVWEDLALLHVRHVAPDQLLQRKNELVAINDPIVRGYVETWLSSIVDHPATDLPHLGQEYLQAPTRDVRHGLFQAHLSQIELMKELHRAGRQLSDEVWDSYRALVSRQVGEPLPDGLAWLDPTGKLLVIEALAVAVRNPTIDSIEEIVDRARALTAGTPERVDALAHAAFAALRSNHFSRALELAQESVRALEGLVRPPTAPGQIHILLGFLQLWTGDLNSALASAERSIEVAAGCLDESTRAEAPGLAALIAAVQGRHDEARKLIAHAERNELDVMRGYAFDALPLARVCLAWYYKTPQECVQLVAENIANPRYESSPWLLFAYVDSLLAVGDVRRAEAILVFDGCPESEWPIELRALHGRIRELNGDRAVGVQILRNCLASATESFTAPLVSLHLSAALAAEPTDELEALDLLEATHSQCLAGGAKVHLQRLEHAINMIRQRRAARVDSLSVRERQVSHLAIKDWTNREIARELGVSTSTVAFHLSRAFEKLQIPSRRHLRSLLSGYRD